MSKKVEARKARKVSVSDEAYRAQSAVAEVRGLSWGVWAAQTLTEAVGMPPEGRAEVSVTTADALGVAATVVLRVGMRDAQGDPVFTARQAYLATRRLQVRHDAPLCWIDAQGRKHPLVIGTPSARRGVPEEIVKDGAFWRRTKAGPR